MEQLEIGSLSVELERKNIKHMHLAVYPPTGKVRLAVPLRVEAETARLFVISKIGWIRRHQRNFQKQERLSPREYKERESHYFQGRRYLLRLQETNGAGYVALRGQTYLDLYVRPGASTAHKQKILYDWYRLQLKEALPKLIAYWEKKIGVTVNDWGIKQMKTKWGSCNISAQRIWLNLELAQKPLHCLEYVVVHEMVHLLERYHNEAFQSHMDHFLPNWRQLKRELNSLPVSHADWRQ